MDVPDNQESSQINCRRTHIVLVPGFVGFDALGQIEYYAGVTTVFNRWLKTLPERSRGIVIHYFDNFPTASVAFRAKRLQEFLMKRIARGEIKPTDCIALIGHSTGGLDIRKMLYDLAKSSQPSIRLDGTYIVNPQQILNQTKRIVFISTPHYGTNIADFACQLENTFKSLSANASLGTELNRGLIANILQIFLQLTSNTESDLLLAVVDALRESNDGNKKNNREQAAAREARAELSLWLEHMGKDYGIIGDLRSYPGLSDTDSADKSPAHYTADQRQEELTLWKEKGIFTCSYATRVELNEIAIVKRIISTLRLIVPGLDRSAARLNQFFDLFQIPPLWALTALGPLGVVVALLYKYPTLAFDVCFELCTSGPFQNPNIKAGSNSIASSVIDFHSQQKVPTESIREIDSDGVVNTLSMLWPYDPNHLDAHSIFLVNGDHGDIIGHYSRIPASDAAPSGRKYDAYNIFKSSSTLEKSPEIWDRVWEDIFQFCNGTAS